MLGKNFEEWAEIYRKPFIQEVTYTKYEDTLRRIESWFGDKQLSEITRKELQKFFNDQSKKYGKLTIKTVHQHLSSFYQSLVDDGEVERNPMNGIRFSGIEKPKKKKYIEADDAKKLIRLLDATKKEDLMIYTALRTGMRFAEVIGLTPSDVIKSNNSFILSVNKTLDYKTTKQFKTTKSTSSVRDIVIDKASFQRLENFIKDNKISSNQSIFGVTFPSSLNRYLNVLCEENSIAPVSFHALRHTHGSLLLKQGIPMLSVSKRLGHASLSITQDVYIHLMDEQKKEDNERITQLLEVM